MMGRRRQVAAWVLALVGLCLLTACSDEVTAPRTDPDLLLTLEFAANYLAVGDTGLVFVTAPDGQVLDTATWTGAARVELRNEAVQPEILAYTIVRYTGPQALLTTRMAVTQGAEISLGGRDIGFRYEFARLEIRNAPDAASYWVSTPYNSFGASSPLPSDLSVAAGPAGSDCFVRTDPREGSPLAAWVHDLTPEQVAVLDFAEPGVFSPLQRYTMAIPAGASEMWAGLGGYGPGGAGDGVFTFGQVHSREVIPDSVVMYGPPAGSAGLKTNLTLRTYAYPLTTSFSQETWGSVPTAMERPADLVVNSTAADSFAFTAAGHWDEFAAVLSSGRFSGPLWNVAGGYPDGALVLPAFPGTMADFCPECDRSGFTLYRLRVSEGARGSFYRELESVWQ